MEKELAFETLVVSLGKYTQNTLHITSPRANSSISTDFLVKAQSTRGHATPCALDCVTFLGAAPSDIVSTFGTPKVGNTTFRRIYNDHIPAHLGFVTAPNPVPNPSKPGYSHAGRKVQLTVAEDFFIDPNSMEFSL